MGSNELYFLKQGHKWRLEVVIYGLQEVIAHFLAQRLEEKYKAADVVCKKEKRKKRRVQQQRWSCWGFHVSTQVCCNVVVSQTQYQNLDG